MKKLDKRHMLYEYNKYLKNCIAYYDLDCVLKITIQK